MAAQDFYDAAALPDLSSDALGVPPVPAPQIPVVTPPQLGLSPDAQKKRQLLSLIALGLSAGMGGPRGTGLAQGLSHAFTQQDLAKRQQDQLALQQYEQDQANQVRLQVAYEAAQQRHELETQRRGQQLTSTLTNLKSDLLKAKTKEQAGSLLTMYGNALSGSGFRGYDANNLSKRGYRWVEPSVEQRASSYLDDLLKDPINANVLQTLQADPVQAKRPVIQFDANGDKVPEAYTLTDFLKLAGRAYFQDPDTNQIILAPKDVAPKMSTPFEASLATGLEKFKADNHRDPTAPEKQQIVKDAVEASKQPADPALAALARETAQLRNDALRRTGDEKAADRLSKSYETSIKELDELRKPVIDRAQRLANLDTSINQQTPQADALLAPELLTTMAGGQGSGLRMNEAEISRIVGGRSNFESLKATLNKWSLDPTKALSITPEQRREMRALAAAVRDRTTAQLAALGTARRALLDAPDVRTHRQIMANLQDQFTGTLTTPSSPAPPATKPPAIDEIRMINGHKGRWDGRGWEAVP